MKTAFYFKVTESPFYNKRKKVKSGAEVDIQLSINIGSGKISRSGAQWINPNNFLPGIFLN